MALTIGNNSQLTQRVLSALQWRQPWHRLASLASQCLCTAFLQLAPLPDSRTHVPTWIAPFDACCIALTTTTTRRTDWESIFFRSVGQGVRPRTRCCCPVLPPWKEKYKNFCLQSCMQCGSAGRNLPRLLNSLRLVMTIPVIGSFKTEEGPRKELMMTI